MERSRGALFGGRGRRKEGEEDKDRGKEGAKKINRRWVGGGESSVQDHFQMVEVFPW